MPDVIDEPLFDTVRRATKITVQNGQSSQPIMVERYPASVSLFPSGTGKVQYSTSPPSEVLAGSALWMDWSLGEVNQPQSDIPDGPITAVRAVSVTGETTIEVVR